jgi:hypothetical protein
MTNLERLAKDLAPQLGLPLDELERICRFQFAWVAENFSSGQYLQMRLPKLGSFHPLDARIARKEAYAIRKNYLAFGFHCC